MEIETTALHLRCCYCNFVWEPRILNPRACPHCKRHFDADHQPERTDEPIERQIIKTPTLVEPFTYMEAHTTLCTLCQQLDQMSTTYAVAKLGDQNLCMMHLESKLKELNSHREA